MREAVRIATAEPRRQPSRDLPRGPVHPVENLERRRSCGGERKEQAVEEVEEEAVAKRREIVEKVLARDGDDDELFGFSSTERFGCSVGEERERERKRV